MICFPLWMQITVNGDKEYGNPNAISPLEIRLENQEAIFSSKDNLKELS